VDDPEEERVACTLTRDGEQLAAWAGLAPPPLVKAGVLTLGLKELGQLPNSEQATDFDIWVPVRPPPPALHLRLGLRAAGALAVEVVAGHHLPSDGSFDMADPYALLELRPAPVRGLALAAIAKPVERLRTKNINNTLDPVWNQTLTFEDCAGYGPPDSMALYYESKEGDTVQSTLQECRLGVAAAQSKGEGPASPPRALGGEPPRLGPEDRVWWPGLGHDDGAFQPRQCTRSVRAGLAVVLPRPDRSRRPGALRWQTVLEAEAELGLLGWAAGRTVGQVWSPQRLD
jgi:hypothetical protein